MSGFLWHDSIVSEISQSCKKYMSQLIFIKCLVQVCICVCVYVSVCPNIRHHRREKRRYWSIILTFPTCLSARCPLSRWREKGSEAAHCHGSAQKWTVKPTLQAHPGLFQKCSSPKLVVGGWGQCLPGEEGERVGSYPGSKKARVPGGQQFRNSHRG